MTTILSDLEAIRAEAVAHVATIATLTGERDAALASVSKLTADVAAALDMAATSERQHTEAAAECDALRATVAALTERAERAERKLAMEEPVTAGAAPAKGAAEASTLTIKEQFAAIKDPDAKRAFWTAHKAEILR